MTVEDQKRLAELMRLRATRCCNTIRGEGYCDECAAAEEEIRKINARSMLRAMKGDIHG